MTMASRHPKTLTTKKGKEVSKKKLARISLIRRFGSESQAQEFLKREATRRKALELDPVFDSETESLRKEIQNAHSYNPQAIESFLRQFPLPVYFHLQQARALLKALPMELKVF
jgi:hypothetical protein